MNQLGTTYSDILNHDEVVLSKKIYQKYPELYLTARMAFLVKNTSVADHVYEIVKNVDGRRGYTIVSEVVIARKRSSSDDGTIISAEDFLPDRMISLGSLFLVRPRCGGPVRLVKRYNWLDHKEILKEFMYVRPKCELDY